MGLHAAIAPDRGGRFWLNDHYFDCWLENMRGWIDQYPVLRE